MREGYLLLPIYIPLIFPSSSLSISLSIANVNRAKNDEFRRLHSIRLIYSDESKSKKIGGLVKSELYAVITGIISDC